MSRKTRNGYSCGGREEPRTRTGLAGKTAQSPEFGPLASSAGKTRAREEAGPCSPCSRFPPLLLCRVAGITSFL